MGFLVDKLYWAPTQIDGSPRSFLAMILDPVGACIQPADLEPFPSNEPAAAVDGEKGSELKDDEEDDATGALTKALKSRLSKDDTVPAPAPELVAEPIAAPLAV